MKTINFFRLLALRIVIIASVMMVWSFLSDFIQMTGFFEDVLNTNPNSYYYNSLDWGWRHFIWTGMGIVLFILACVKVGFWGDWYWTQVSDNGDVDFKADENRLF